MPLVLDHILLDSKKENQLSIRFFSMSFVKLSHSTDFASETLCDILSWNPPYHTIDHSPRREETTNNPSSSNGTENTDWDNSTV